ncbi:sigma-70 family RNA polymerase sigma factor [Mucilaginibacter phyllosphaerae]|uniref:sigma-70 family RNA polymerase sigma factor n=1 Tax=Mucilaginibacter phyllosphaerae TaxID=1812349 RepID=UPI0021D34308|nr:sigma-70 family RNA polymerase sigma factor [Mucilaginibacter phyllosphaerae]
MPHNFRHSSYYKAANERLSFRKALIEKEIAELPPRMREVFEMSRKQTRTYKEITEQLGTSEETVKKQVSGALKVLRVKLGVLIYILILIHY